MADISALDIIPSVAPSTTAPDRQLDVQPKAAAGLEQLGAAGTDLSKVFGQIQVDDVSNNVIKQARTLTDQYQTLNGADALSQRASYQQRLDDLFNQGQAQLGSLDQIEQYQQVTRTYQDRYFGGVISSHADQQAKAYQAMTNAATKQNGLDMITGDPNNPDAFASGLNLILSGTAKDLQAAGYSTDPTISTAWRNQAIQTAYSTRALGMAASNPQAALDFVNQNQKLLGPKYYDLSHELTGRAAAFSGQNAGTTAFNEANGGGVGTGGLPPGLNPPAARGVPTGQPSVDQVFSAVWGNESGGAASSPTSVNGARGPLQIEPGTFQQFAQPGQDINRAADNIAVGKSMIQHYYQQYDGDPARVAVAYFSGPGNVAPPGSPTPYINNVADKNGTTVSQYVQNLQNKLGQPPSAQQNAILSIVNNPNLTPEAKEVALRTVKELTTAQQVAQQGTEQQREQQSYQATQKYTTQLAQLQASGAPVPADVVQSIAADPNLSGESKEHLMDIALTASGQKTTDAYGTGYRQAFASIAAPYGTPGKITDPNQILQMGAAGTLSPSGVSSLLTALKASQGGIDEQGLVKAQNAMLAYAHSKLSFDDPGNQFMPPTKDPAGEAIYNSQFVPQMESMYQSWVKKGNNPIDFYTQDKKAIDGLITSLRSPAQMNAARLDALNGMVPGAGGVPTPTPAPPPPEGISQGSWSSVLSSPPSVQGGGTYSAAQWGQVLTWLAADPLQNGPIFDKKFAGTGYTSADLLQQLGKGPKPTGQQEQPVPSSELFSQ